ncbi:hypothetical protein [uncultured Psychroserpens sp.]|uniref:hypothetical protein n=1 Tax=uncultured Psychroserpens sp. TaxID=255436 RepID=UPI0026350590|nr:hypothetical protein [uncultured Psychroserpens sp.]
MKIKRVYLYYLFLFVIVGLLTLNFNYVEGDDARTILYHVFGRDVSFQPPYSPYHSMIDTLLAVIQTTNETTLRIFSISLTFISSFFVLVFMTKIFERAFKTDMKGLVLFLIVLPFIIPETLLSGLFINPTNISFALILASHVLLIKYEENQSIITLIFSVLLFGLGVSFRWSNGFYLFVLYGYYVLYNVESIKDMFKLKSLKMGFIIFPFYILSVVIWIQISGYSVKDIIDVYLYGSSYIEDKEFSLLSSLASMISFSTPAFLVLLVFGIYHCLKKKIYIPLLLLVFSSLPYVFLGMVPMYKYLITLVVPLVVILIYGYKIITNRNLKIAVIVIVFLPWIFGLQVKNNTAWGPGFEVRAIENNAIDANNFNPDKSTSISDVSVVFGSGMAMPTSEGPRPLFGFGGVMLYGWNQFLKDNNNERESAVNYAIENNCNILQDVNHSFIASKLCELGFTTKDRLNASNELGVHRTFSNVDTRISIDVLENKKALFNNELMNSYLSKNQKVVVYSSYTNIITKLKSKYGDQFKQQGAFWGILILNN